VPRPPNRVPIRCGGAWRSVPAVACNAWPCTIVHSPLHVQRISYTWHAYSSRRKWTFDLGTIDSLFFLKKSEELPLIALSLPRRRSRHQMQRTRDVHCRCQRLCSQPGKQCAELWPALPASGSNSMDGELSLASDNSCDRHEWSSIGHGHAARPPLALPTCMSRSSIPTGTEKDRERPYSNQMLAHSWHHSGMITCDLSLWRRQRKPGDSDTMA
jgi:hypothetical protein